MAGLVTINSKVLPWQLQCPRKEATEEPLRGPGHLRWRPRGHGMTGLAVAPQPVLPREPPSPTPDPLELPLGPPQGPCTFLFHLPQKPLLLASAPVRTQPHQPRGPRAEPLTAPSGIALRDFSSTVAAAATAAAAAMVAPAAQNANYRLGQVTGWVGGAEARGCGLYSGGRSQSGRITSVGAEPMRAPRKLRTWGSKTTDSSQRSRGYRS